MLGVEDTTSATFIKKIQSDAQTVYNSTGDVIDVPLKLQRKGRRLMWWLMTQMCHPSNAPLERKHGRCVFPLQIQSTSTKGLQVWRIRDLVAKAGKLVVSHLLFLHTWSGCDTTSATFGQGVKKIHVNEEVQQISSLMSNPNVTTEEVGKAGARLFVLLYGGKQKDSLNLLRYVKFLDMVTSSKVIDPQKLPPTESSTFP